MTDAAATIRRTAANFFCMKCAKVLGSAMLCSRSAAFDGGTDHHEDDERFEGLCISCCTHNHA